MKQSRLVLAAAGSGKTTFLVNRALELEDKEILITTFTIANETEIRKKFVEINGCMPMNITVKTWFSFLIQHGARPYQSYITENKINGMVLVSEPSGIQYKIKGKPIPYPEIDVDNHYFNKEYKIYSDKLSKFVFNCNKLSEKRIVKRLESIYDCIFVDEIQDLAGYDLEILKLINKSKIELLMVGDPRQVTYYTHFSTKNKKYTEGKIREYVIDKFKAPIPLIDETTLSNSHRCNMKICEYSSRLYPNMSKYGSNNHEVTGHDGIFFVKKSDVAEYLKKFKATQLRYNKSTQVVSEFEAFNFGDSKGLTFDRVLIYPTKGQLGWIFDNNADLKSQIRSKLYVALTRARHSVAIVYDYKEEMNVDGIENYYLESVKNNT